MVYNQKYLQTLDHMTFVWILKNGETHQIKITEPVDVENFPGRTVFEMSTGHIVTVDNTWNYSIDIKKYPRSKAKHNCAPM